MKVYITDKIITREKVRENPDTLYLFGDNILRKGLGGQAKEMRGEPNTVGIVSKRYPNNNDNAFFTDQVYVEFVSRCSDDLRSALLKALSGKYTTVVIPQIGVGLANLPERAPQCYWFLQQGIQNLKTVLENS